MVKIKKQRVRPNRKKEISKRKLSLGIKTILRFLIAIILVGGVGIGLVRLKYMFVDSNYFIVETVDVRLYDEKRVLRNIPLGEFVKEDVIGKNVLFIKLDELKHDIEDTHPEFKDIIVRRVLPNKLIVQASLREAVAQIRSDRYYPVDKDGVLLPDVKNFPAPDLPVITGIGINIAKREVFKFTRFEKEKLDKGIALINEMRSIDKLKDYKLKIVDVNDPGNISFFLESLNVEIKIGNSDFHDRLVVFTTLLSQLNSDIDRFKYIDLRFDDPIIGPR